MGYSKNTSYNHRNINVTRLIRLHEMLINGVNRNNALRHVLTSSSPRHRRRGEGPSVVRAHAMNQARQHLVASHPRKRRTSIK
jgi:hypothetical protein